MPHFDARLVLTLLIVGSTTSRFYLRPSRSGVIAGDPEGDPFGAPVNPVPRKPTRF